MSSRFSSLMVFVVASMGCTSTTTTGGGDPGARGPTPCDPGTRPTTEDGVCEPVGPTSCADGFRRAPDGWGCEAVMPASACTGTARAALGVEECVPDDCSAAFPPAGADVVVGTQAELEDALATVRAGGTIAVRAGTYAPFTIDRSVNVVGECAEKVRVRGTGPRGIYVVGDGASAPEVRVSGFDVSGFDGGIVVAYGPKVVASGIVAHGNRSGLVAGEATVELANSVIDASDVTAGNGLLTQLGAKVTLSSVEVRGAQTAINAVEDGTEVTVRRSILQSEGQSRTAKMILAYGGARVNVEESALLTRAMGLATVGTKLPNTTVGANGVGARLRIANSEVRQVGFLRERPLATAAEGASIELDGTSVLHESVFAFMVGDPGSSFSMKRSSIRGTETEGEFRSAVYVTLEATAEIEDSAFVAARQTALTVGHAGSKLSVRRSIVADTVFYGPGPFEELGGGGIAVGAGKEASLVMQESAVVGSQQFGIMAESGAYADITSCLVDGTARGGVDGDVGGDAVVVTSGAKLTLTSSLIRGSADAAVMAIAGEGIVENTRFVENQVGIHLTATRLRETNVRPEAAGSQELVLVNSTFVETTSRVRESEFALPGGVFR